MLVRKREALCWRERESFSAWKKIHIFWFARRQTKTNNFVHTHTHTNFSMESECDYECFLSSALPWGGVVSLPVMKCLEKAFSEEEIIFCLQTDFSELRIRRTEGWFSGGKHLMSRGHVCVCACVCTYMHVSVQKGWQGYRALPVIVCLCLLDSCERVCVDGARVCLVTEL